VAGVIKRFVQCRVSTKMVCGRVGPPAWPGRPLLPTLRTAQVSRLRLKCDGTRAETRFRLSAKRASQFISGEASVQWTTGSRDVRISGSNAGYTKFRGSVKSTGYPLHSPVSPSLPLPASLDTTQAIGWSATRAAALCCCCGYVKC
jgi:hypothetical protein